MAGGTYIQLTREEFEEWLESLGFQGAKQWKIKPGRGGVYLLPLSDKVAVEINSTTGTKEEVMGRGRASMSLRLVSLITGFVLNKKAMGQSHFARTINWRDNWAKGVERMKDAYIKAKSWYDTIAAIEDRDAYKDEITAEIEAIPGWAENQFLTDLHGKVQQGGVLTEKQREAIGRSRGSTQAPTSSPTSSPASPRGVAEDDPLLLRMRGLYSAARRTGDQWTMDFVKSIADQYKAGRGLSPKQQAILDQKFDDYRVRAASVRVADRWFDGVRE
jgi:hypothetical protein